MRIRIAVVLAGCLCVARCIDSPLSDVELNDFSVLKITCSVDQQMSVSSVQKYCRVQIVDKNGFGVKIKNGSVSVNGTNLSYDDFFKIYGMPLSGIPVTKNTLYIFVITLSNGDTCMARVVTPRTEFGTVVCPSPIHLLQDTAITWTDFAGEPNQISLEIDVDSDADTVSRLERVFSGTVPDAGRCALTHDLFDPARQTGKGSVTLSSMTVGSVSDKVRGGSEVTARFSYERDVAIVR
jgi:hypothetical protein